MKKDLLDRLKELEKYHLEQVEHFVDLLTRTDRCTISYQQFSKFTKQHRRWAKDIRDVIKLFV